MTASTLNVTVRMERNPDLPFVRDAVTAAFGRTAEADIVDGVRGTDDWLADGSIVAVAENNRVIGHVLLTRARLVAADGSATLIGVIGPVAVLPVMQRRGVGNRLMRAAISAAITRRLPMICLLGHDSYYPRFGFEPARPLGILPPDPSWPAEAWMALRLPGWVPALRGVVRYPPAFGGAEVSERRRAPRG